MNVFAEPDGATLHMNAAETFCVLFSTLPFLSHSVTKDISTGPIMASAAPMSEGTNALAEKPGYFDVRSWMRATKWLSLASALNLRSCSSDSDMRLPSDGALGWERDIIETRARGILGLMLRPFPPERRDGNIFNFETPPRAPRAPAHERLQSRPTWLRCRIRRMAHVGGEVRRPREALVCARERHEGECTCGTSRCSRAPREESQV